MFSIYGHHEAPGDPTLLGWITDRIDHFLGLEPLESVFLFGILIILIPVLVLGLYFMKSRKQLRS